jgi:prophage maintenance system killer protein
MPHEYARPDLDDVLELAKQLLGDRPPVRDVGLLGSAVARPQTTVFGEDAYPDLWVKAAALLDGNRRLGWLSTAVFLDINGQTSRRRAITTCMTLSFRSRPSDWIASGLTG